MNDQSCRPRGSASDLVGSRLGRALWGVSCGLVVIGLLWPGEHVWLWVLALLLAGSVCVTNASRCGRRHCYVTGPVYLLAALAILLDHAGMVTIGGGWILAWVIGSMAVGFGLERIRGTYRS